jgi:hypothetical protein
MFFWGKIILDSDKNHQNVTRLKVVVVSPCLHGLHTDGTAAEVNKPWLWVRRRRESNVVR